MLKHIAIALTLALGLGGAAPAQDRTDRGVTGETPKAAEVGILKISPRDMEQVKKTLETRGCPCGSTAEELNRAIEKFQKQVAIEHTGKLDVATLNALGFGAIVAISSDVRGAEFARAEPEAAVERPAGL